MQRSSAEIVIQEILQIAFQTTRIHNFTGEYGQSQTRIYNPTQQRHCLRSKEILIAVLLAPRKEYGESTIQIPTKQVGKIIAKNQSADNQGGEDCFLFASASMTEAIQLYKVITIQS